MFKKTTKATGSEPPPKPAVHHYDSRGYETKEEASPSAHRAVTEPELAAVVPETIPPVLAPPATAGPDVKAQIAMLHLLAEQLRNQAGDIHAVNSVVEQLKRAADALLATWVAKNPGQA